MQRGINPIKSLRSFWSQSRTIKRQRQATMAPSRFKTPSGCTLTLEQGDITKYEGDAIVNAANEAMLGGGGVDGAIHDAAGPELREECEEYPAPGGARCPTGHARITSGCALPAKYVIHTVGPVFDSHEESAPLLKLAYMNCLTMAAVDAYGIKRLAFPALSCGVFGYPVLEAAAIALRTCAEQSGSLQEITFMLFGAKTFQQFQEAAEGLSEVLTPVAAGEGSGYVSEVKTEGSDFKQYVGSRAEGDPKVDAPEPPNAPVTTAGDAVAGCYGNAATVDASQGAKSNEVLGDGSAQNADEDGDQDMAKNEVIDEGANEEAKKEVLP